MPVPLRGDPSSTPPGSRKASARQTTINIRVHDRQIGLIDQAAELLGQSRSAFMLERSLQAAETVLLDQRLFAVDDKTYEAFRQALEQPLAENPRLSAFLRKPSAWET